MQIVIDTTELFREPYLESIDWKIVTRYLKSHHVRLIVPEVVIEEAVAHFVRKCESAKSDARRSIGQLNKLLKSKLTAPNVEVDCSKYRKDLKTRLTTLKADVPKVGSVAIGQLLKRAVNKRKPFTKDGAKGFRDSLLWEAVLEAAKTDDVLLVTENGKDFGRDGELAEDLKDDLVSLGLETSRVTLFESIRKFSDEIARPSLDALDEFADKLLDDSGSFQITPFLAGKREEIVERVREAVPDTETLKWPGDIHDIRLIHLRDEPYNIDIGRVHRLPPDNITFSMSVRYFGEVSADAYEYEGRHEPPTVHAVVGGIVCDIYIKIILNEESGDLVEYEISDIEIDLDGPPE